MGTMRDALAGLALLLSIGGAAAAEAAQLPALLAQLKLAGYREGTQPPPFTAEGVDSRAVSLTGVRGKVVLVNFWASWCAECRPEMPVLERLHRELGPKGLAVIGVNAREDASTVRKYASVLRLTFPLAVDTAGTVNQTYGVVAIPSTFLIARDGRAVAFGIGPRDWGGTHARALLEALLAEPPSRGERP